MRLNPDLIRDILLVVEENCTLTETVDSTLLFSKIKGYDEETIMYHVNQAELSGLFTKVDHYWGIDLSIRDLSPEGHKFVNEIRNDNAWNKTKNSAAKLGNYSFQALMTIASDVTTNLISKQLGI
ncbi:DUF2513 domain-containing protein [Lactococcus sp.]|uniref:DUF2513 domain-containing protein n=1 Tax=Lactococcus sp. TaxID=44273 RepID=UPI0035B29CA3